ncbi:MAG: HAMP domain-containing histidine kinase [Microscillaceae bacterium]|jgi:two-component system phosphate regulon sensor histidine kinase PhoR|nr:HAMP domain-containing histidine kinase [Microscillaceae bacterium]
MKGKNLKYFIVLLTLALIGLVALQFYWVTVALEVNHDTFEHDVHEVLDEVASQLEQKEILYLVNDYSPENNQSLTADVLNKMQILASLDSPKNKPHNLIAQTPNRTTNPNPKTEVRLNAQPLGSIILEETAFSQSTVDSLLSNISQVNVFQNEYRPLGSALDSADNLFQVSLIADTLKRKRKSSQIVFSEPGQSSIGKIWIDSNYTNLSANQVLRLNIVEQNLIPKKDASAAIQIRSNPKYDLKQNYLPSQPKPKEVVKINNKKDLVTYVIDRWRDRQTQIRERLNQKLIDSLLHQATENKGIELNYEFMVEYRPNYFADSLAQIKKLANNKNSKLSNFKSPPTKSVEYLFCENDQKRQQILSAGMHVKLFPTESLSNPPILHIYFPNEEAYILRNMWWMFGSSLLFIGVVLYCFFQAISTILRQKKTSEITTDFINNMTHELKTPISTVALACEALQDPDIKQLPNQHDRYLNIIKEENERLGRQVEKVLQIARLDKGDFKLKICEVNVHQIINQAIRNIAIQIESRGGTIETKLHATLPLIDADEVHLCNMIHNLLDNANKYSPEMPHITVKTENAPNGIYISIIDQGLGMAKEHLTKVFDKFYRIPTGNIHNVKGFGLGLSYVKTMVDAHHGHINVQSEPNKGSTFTIQLPYKYVKI